MDAVQRREPPVPPRPVLVCVDPAGHFLSVGLFRNSQLVFLLEDNLLDTVSIIQGDVKYQAGSPCGEQ